MSRTRRQLKQDKVLWLEKYERAKKKKNLFAIRRASKELAKIHDEEVKLNENA